MLNRNIFDRGSIENERLQIAKIFLTGQLEKYETVFWAINTTDKVIQSAISEIVEQSLFKEIKEPWLQAWRLILQGWKEAKENRREQSTEIYTLARRIDRGEESIDLIKSIVNLVAPKIKISRNLKVYGGGKLKPPKVIDDIVSISLENGFVIPLDALDVSALKSQNLLAGIAEASGQVLDERLGLSRFLNIDLWLRWRHNEIRRIIRPINNPGTEHSNVDLDFYSEGFAGLARLHYEAIISVSKIDVSQAKFFANLCLQKSHLYIYLRIWAAIAYQKLIVDSAEVFDFLNDMADEVFWDAYGYPETQELMARRFPEMSARHQELLISRIANGPPESMFKKSSVRELKEYKAISTARELKRLIIGGAVLNQNTLQLIALGEGLFPQLRLMNAIDYDFEDVRRLSWGRSNTAPEYSKLSSEDRVKRLQKDLLTHRMGFEDDIAQAARSWISDQINFSVLAKDISKVDDIEIYDELLKHFLASHRPPNPGDLTKKSAELVDECSYVFNKLNLFNDVFIEKYVKDICGWCNQWKSLLIQDPRFVDFWERLLKFSILDVERQAIPGEELNLSIQIKSNSDDHQDLDVYGSSISDLVSIFFEIYSLAEKKSPGTFRTDLVIQSMRDSLIVVSGRPGLMIKHRFIEHVSYFYSKDPDWTRINLLTLLTAETSETAALWRAISHNRLTPEVIEIIGGTIASKVCDQSLSKSSRLNLAWSLVVEIVNSCFDRRPPKISQIDVQQMLRMSDDEVRAHAIKIVEKFINEVSARNETYTKYEIYQLVGKQFFKDIWPQEISLVTQSISKSLASLPIAIPGHLNEVVGDIERFLKPFSAWSMQDYGAGYLGIDQNDIEFIKTGDDVIGFTKLLSLTIDDQDGSVIPYDLSIVLAHMSGIYPKIKKDTDYVRLLRIARRG